MDGIPSDIHPQSPTMGLMDPTGWLHESRRWESLTLPIIPVLKFCYVDFAITSLHISDPFITYIYCYWGNDYSSTTQFISFNQHLICNHP